MCTEEKSWPCCRRIANRESARRVRQKRQDVMEDLQVKVSESFQSLVWLHTYLLGMTVHVGAYLYES